ncbi:MAG: alpha amylase C-terminal domain-containing protein, partial [Bacteroidota bacterium]
DEVVHGKNSIIYKMPGDDWQRFANVRLLYTYMFAHVGTKLLFMGNDIAQTSEWNHSASVDWRLLDFKPHQGIKQLIGSLNSVYRHENALHHYNFDPKGFEWVDYQDGNNSVISFIRKDDSEYILVICNFTPVVRDNYRIGVPIEGVWKELFNSDDDLFGGSNIKNGSISSEPIQAHGKDHSINITLPPLAGVYFKLST